MFEGARARVEGPRVHVQERVDEALLGSRTGSIQVIREVCPNLGHPLLTSFTKFKFLQVKIILQHLGMNGKFFF